MGFIRRPWLTRASDGNLARKPGLHPYSLQEVPWDFFNDHRESGPRFNVSSERRYNTLPVSLLRHTFLTSLRPNHWRYQKSLCNLTSSVSWDHADQVWWWSDEDSRTSTWNYTECVFQTIQHGRLPVGRNRLTVSMKVVWLMRSIGVWILVTVGETVCATEPHIKGCNLRLMKLISVV